MQLIPRAPQSRWPKGVTCHQRLSKRKNFKIIPLPPEQHFGSGHPSAQHLAIKSVPYISLNSEHNIVYLFVNRFLYPKDLTNFPGSINYHFSTICANGMQQYCRPSAVITGIWLWKEFHTEIRMQASHLQEFTVVCSKGTAHRRRKP